jgi:hypothetical protein
VQCEKVAMVLEYKVLNNITMKKLLAIATFLFVAIVAFGQTETERVFLYKKNGAYFVRIEVPYDYAMAIPENKLLVEVPEKNIHFEASLSDMPKHQSQNEFTDYVAVYDFPLGKHSVFKKLNCRISFDYKQVEEKFSLEFHKFVWL